MGAKYRYKWVYTIYIYIYKYIPTCIFININPMYNLPIENTWQ